VKPSNLTAFRLAWHFVMGNKWLHTKVVLFILVMTILGSLAVSAIGKDLVALSPVIFLILTLIFSANYYFAQEILHVNSYEEMREIARSTTFSELLFSHITEGAALALGSAMVWGIYMLGSMALDFLFAPDDIIQRAVARQSGPQAALEVLLSVVLFYLAMGPFGRAMMAGGGFWPTFREFLSIFSPRYWLKTLNIRYFMLVMGWELVEFGVVFVGMVIKYFLIFISIALFAAMAKGSGSIGSAMSGGVLSMIFAFKIIETFIVYFVTLLMSYYSAAVAVFAAQILDGSEENVLHS